MQAKGESSWMSLDGPQAAAWCRQPAALRLLTAFMVQPDTLSMAAAAATMPMPSAWRWLQRWQSIGAVRQVATQVRAGRTVPVYGAAAARYFIPYEAEGRHTLPDELIGRLVAQRVRVQALGLMEAARRTRDAGPVQRWGTVLYLDRWGELVVRPDFELGRTPDLLADQGPAYLNFHTESLHLSAAQAKALQRELVALIKRYKALGDSTQRHALSVVMTPVPPKPGPSRSAR